MTTERICNHVKSMKKGHQVCYGGIDAFLTTDEILTLHLTALQMIRKVPKPVYKNSLPVYGEVTVYAVTDSTLEPERSTSYTLKITV